MTRTSCFAVAALLALARPGLADSLFTTTYEGLPVMEDSSQGLYWLNLNQTTNLSYTQLQNTLNSKFPNFKLANAIQITALYQDAGIRNLNQWESGSSSDIAAIYRLQQLWGVTAGGSTTPSSMYYDPPVTAASNNIGFLYTIWTTLGQSLSGGNYTPQSNMVTSSNPPGSGIGFALVALVPTVPTPEPSTPVSLVGMGLLGLGGAFLRRRHRTGQDKVFKNYCPSERTNSSVRSR